MDGGGIEIGVSVGTKNWTVSSDLGSSDVDDVSRYDRDLNPRRRIVELLNGKYFFHLLLPRNRLREEILLFDSCFSWLFSSNERFSIEIGCKFSLISCDFSFCILLSSIFSIESVTIDSISSSNEDVFVNGERRFRLRKCRSVFNDEFVFNTISSSDSKIFGVVEILSNSLLE